MEGIKDLVSKTKGLIMRFVNWFMNLDGDQQLAIIFFTLSVSIFCVTEVRHWIKYHKSLYF